MDVVKQRKEGRDTREGLREEERRRGQIRRKKNR